jgi:hypothetical protein
MGYDQFGQKDLLSQAPCGPAQVPFAFFWGVAGRMVPAEPWSYKVQMTAVIVRLMR